MNRSEAATVRKLTFEEMRKETGYMAGTAAERISAVWELGPDRPGLSCRYKMLNEDFKDILLLLLEEKADFLLIGAYALAAYGYPRATKDIDLWVRAGQANAPRIQRA